MQMANLSARSNQLAFRVDSVIRSGGAPRWMPALGMRAHPTGDFIGVTRNSEQPPTGGSLGTDKRCVSSADSDSIAAGTASRKRLERCSEKGAGLRLQDRQADQDGIDDALHRVVAQPVPRERSRSASHDPTHCEQIPYPAAWRDAIDIAISAACLQAIPLTTDPATPWLPGGHAPPRVRQAGRTRVRRADDARPQDALRARSGREREDGHEARGSGGQCGASQGLVPSRW